MFNISLGWLVCGDLKRFDEIKASDPTKALKKFSKPEFFGGLLGSVFLVPQLLL